VGFFPSSHGIALQDSDIPKPTIKAQKVGSITIRFVRHQIVASNPRQAIPTL
jgi:hypothetical protein